MTRLRRSTALLTGVATLVAGLTALTAQPSNANPVVPIIDEANPGDAAVAYPGAFPGDAAVASVTGGYRLSNAAITATITGGTTPNITGIVAHGVASDFTLRTLFSLKLADGTLITPAQTTPGALTTVDVAAVPDSVKLADRHPGKATKMTFRYDTGGRSFDLTWTAILRDGSNYVQSQFEITNVVGTFDITSVDFFNATLTGGRIVGRDNGNPVVQGSPGAETFFAAVENPMAKQTVSGSAVSFPIARSGDLVAGQDWHYSAVVGASPAGQLRRAFLYYLERERAHARRPFLHYQSWFDLKPPGLVINAPELNHAIDLFGTEMDKRGATLDSYWIDDGWDYLRAPQVADESNLKVWDFDPTMFPNGFTAQKAKAAEHGGSLSVWMSPFGGYGDSANRRLQLNNSKPADQRYEYTGGRFAISGERYNARFRDVVFRMMDQYNVQGFKFDGIGGGLHQTGPAATFLRDYEMLLDMMEDMRTHRNDVFINTTVGTWGSPYWSWITDSIWRDGDDADQVGQGDPREKYINYRDSVVYQYNVTENPLNPITNLMNHGFIFSDRAPQFTADNDLSKPAVRAAVAADMRGYFAMGLSLQELYVRNTLVDPAKVGQANADWFWDELAKNAKWNRANTALLTDTHWLGGNAAQAQIYGTAAWSDVTGSEKSMVMLRNPSARAQTYTMDIGKDLDIPARAAGRYKLVERDGQTTDIVVGAGTPFYLTMKPFEVLLFEGTPTTDALTPSDPPPPAPVPLSTTGWTATASSQQLTGETPPSGPAAAAIDGRIETHWHSQYQPTTAQYPHWYRIDMAEARKINAFEYIPRSDSANGAIDKYTLSYSLEGTTWTAIKTNADFDGTQTFVEFPELEARYLRVDILAPQTANHPWATAAEFRVYGPTAPVDPVQPKLIPVPGKLTWSAACDSEELTGEDNGNQGPCALAVDGKEDTYWHTKFTGGADPMPHQIVVGMAGTFQVSQFIYQPRQGYADANGFIKDYELYTSTDGTTWGEPVAKGTFDYSAGSTANRFVVDFPERTAGFFKFVALSSKRGNAYAGAAELTMMMPNPDWVDPSATPTATATATATPTVTPTTTPTVTATTTATVTTTPTVTATSTATTTTSVTATATVTSTATATTTATTTVSPTMTTTVTATATTSPTATTGSTATSGPSVTTTPARPWSVYTAPGFHRYNGREWFTTCEKYSITERCRTDIWATQVDKEGGQYVVKTGWVFNNLTYLPSPRSAWTKNPLGYTGTWTAANGKVWMTECDTARTGRNACRSYIWTNVVTATPKSSGGYTFTAKYDWVFNNIVLFSA